MMNHQVCASCGLCLRRKICFAGGGAPLFRLMCECSLLSGPPSATLQEIEEKKDSAL